MIKCPKCGWSYYTIRYSTTTCLAWQPIFKDGELINENPNTTTMYCTCLNCGNEFGAIEGRDSDE
jgi:ribosomal protein S27E